MSTTSVGDSLPSKFTEDRVPLINRYGIRPMAPSGEIDLTLWAEAVYRLVFRRNFQAPGFALIDFGPDSTSSLLRMRMIELKEALSKINLARDDKQLNPVWLGRFNQQVTTKLHLDGGPDASVLLLGYEPTQVSSRLRIADYSRKADELGISPAELLEQHNPMFPEGEDLLLDVTTELTLVNRRHYQLLVVNNSRLSSSDLPGWQGVLHQAIITNPMPAEKRCVNAMLLTESSRGAIEPLSAEQIHQFLTPDAATER